MTDRSVEPPFVSTPGAGGHSSPFEGSGAMSSADVRVEPPADVSAMGDGGMSTASGTSAMGSPGPTSSLGPTAYERGMAAGAAGAAERARTAAYDKPLEHVDPITPLIVGVGTGGWSGVVNAAISASLLNASDQAVHPGTPGGAAPPTEPPDDAGAPWDATMPDATLDPGSLPPGEPQSDPNAGVGDDGGMSVPPPQ